MNSVYCFLLYCVVISCVLKTDDRRLEYRNQENLVEKENIFKLSDNINLVEIECLFFGEFNDKSSIIKLTDDKLEVFRNGKEIEIKIDERQQYLIDYINRLYIEKREKIVFSKNDEPAPVTDYPSIIVKIFKNNKEILINEETLYINIEFNPAFIMFYNLLSDLTVK